MRYNTQANLKAVPHQPRCSFERGAGRRAGRGHTLGYTMYYTMISTASRFYCNGHHCQKASYPFYAPLPASGPVCEPPLPLARPQHYTRHPRPRHRRPPTPTHSSRSRSRTRAHRRCTPHAARTCHAPGYRRRWCGRASPETAKLSVTAALHLCWRALDRRRREGDEPKVPTRPRLVRRMRRRECGKYRTGCDRRGAGSRRSSSRNTLVLGLGC
ncbi:hypothetical protein V8E53_001646 [Lactarius tabidus]